MKKFVFIALMASLLVSVAAAVAADNCDQLMTEAERIWLAHDFNGSDKVLADAVKACPNRAEIYWRQARNEYDRIEAIPRNKKPGKDALIARYRGIEALAQKCMQLAPADGNCYLWKGIGMGRRGTTQGILNSLTEAAELERTFLKAEKLAPQYRAADGSANALADAYDALGQFYRVVPEWLCTFGIRQIVGTCGDLKKSVAYLRKAVAREPKRIEYQKDLAVSLICHGQKANAPAEVEEGKKLLQSLQALPSFKSTDDIDKEHSRMILKDLTMACGYSRDAQQEQSQDSYRGPK